MDAADGRERFVEHALVRVGVTDVLAYRKRPSAQRFDFRGDRLRRLDVAVRDHDVGAAFSHEQCDCTSNAIAASGNNGNFSLEFQHVCLQM
jgi:hypothetical protein